MFLEVYELCLVARKAIREKKNANMSFAISPGSVLLLLPWCLDLPRFSPSPVLCCRISFASGGNDSRESTVLGFHAKVEVERSLRSRYFRHSSSKRFAETSPGSSRIEDPVEPFRRNVFVIGRVESMPRGCRVSLRPLS